MKLKFKYFLKILFYSLLTIIFVISLSFTFKNFNNISCKKINIIISDSINNKFITTKDIVAFLNAKKIDLTNKKIKELNLHKLEELLDLIPFIKKTTIYYTLDSTINIEIIQRKPIIRIIGTKTFNFYIDEEGFILPSITNFAPLTLVAVGNINIPKINFSKKNNIFNLNDNSTNILISLFVLAQKINNDLILKSLINHIYVNHKEEIELIPTFGNFKFILGDTSNLDNKLNYVIFFYKKLYNKLGDNLQHINLKFKNQILIKKFKYE